MPVMSLRLEELFADGTLVRPDRRDPDLVDLVKAIATATGVRDLDTRDATHTLASLIAPASDHLVFILLDGLGMNLLERLPPGSFLARSFRREIRSTFPSTTACALTSVNTCQYPNRHAITGWFTYLPELELTAAMLPFVERISGRSLVLQGVHIGDFLPQPPVIARMQCDALTIVPVMIANSEYNTWARAGTGGAGYAAIAHAVDRIISRVTSSTGPTYTHLYLPEVDTLCHKLGVSHPQIPELIAQIDAELARLADAVRGRARIVVTADHGLIDVPVNDQTLLLAGDPLLETLIVPPTGDARMPIFHVRPGADGAFRDEFDRRFGDRMVLLSVDEAERMELFGPGPFGPVARRRFGDYVGIAFRAATLSYHPPEKPLGHLHVAVHAGLSPEEMRVPLWVA